MAKTMNITPRIKQMLGKVKSLKMLKDCEKINFIITDWVRQQELNSENGQGGLLAQEMIS